MACNAIYVCTGMQWRSYGKIEDVMSIVIKNMYHRLWLTSVCAFLVQVVSEYGPNRGYALNNETHALQTGMTV